MVEKYKVKNYVTNIIGKEYIIPTLAVYNNANEINFDKLPNQFVLKCNHDSKSVIVCKDKNKFDKKAAIIKLGIVTPSVAKIIESLSCHLPRFKAEIMPAGIPIINAITKARPPTVKEAGKLSEIISLTEIPSYLYEGPKSSLNTFNK